jgi:hypothetical protein
MTLIESERLIRRLTDALQRRVPEAQMRSLAQDYAEACRGVAHRLEQCAAMLAQDDEPQALQLAEAPPPLLDLISRLAFREAAEWRTFCLAHDLPAAEAFEGKFIRQLSEAYGKGITADHQLYREYREAVLRNQDARAVAAIRAIGRRNPSDANAARELERLETRVTNGTRERIAAALAAGDDGRAVAQAEEFEALDLRNCPTGDVWQRAQRLRCQALLRRAQTRRAANDWSGTAPLLTAIADLCQEHTLVLAAADAQAVGELTTWVEAQQRADADDGKFSRVRLALQQILNLAEEKQLAARTMGRRELRDDLESLERKWREITQFNRPVEESLAARARKTTQLLRVQLAQKNRLFRNVVIAAVAVFAIAAVALSLTIKEAYDGRRFAAELVFARQHRQVDSAKKLVQQIRAHDPRLAATPALVRELQQTESFLTGEQQRQQAGETALARVEELSKSAFVGTPPDQAEARFQAARKAVAEVAEDWQPPLRTRLSEAEGKWTDWLSQQRPVRNTKFEQQLADVETQADADLKYERGVEAIRAALAQMEPAFRDLEAQVPSPVPQLALAAPLTTRWTTLQARRAAFRTQLEKWDGVTRQWQNPTTLEAYLESLKTFHESELSPQAQKQPAFEVLSLNATLSRLLAGLLLPEDPAAWERFQRRSEDLFAPPDIMPGERSLFNQLRDDENIHNVTICKLTVSTGPVVTREVFACGVLTTNRTGRKTGKVYDPGETPDAARALTFKPRDIHRADIEEVGRAPEAALFERLGLKELIDTRTGTNYSGSLLSALDRINDERAANPVFRAYLALRLGDLMELRATEWGAAWAPALAADLRRLRQLTGTGASTNDTLRSGDWLVPVRVEALRRPLEAHFQQAGRISYQRQGKFLSTLARRAMETGFALAGHADATGQPALPRLPADGAELWGWAAASKAPALLFRYHAADRRYVTVNAAMPFTPLLVFRTDRRQLLAQVRQSATAQPEELGTYLPPLFAAPHE